MRKIASKIGMGCCMVTALLFFGSCDDKLEIQQAYPFTIETMPVPKKLKVGETIEIRCQLKREGYYPDYLQNSILSAGRQRGVENG